MEKNWPLKNNCKEDEKQLKVAGGDNPRRHGNERERGKKKQGTCLLAPTPRNK